MMPPDAKKLDELIDGAGLIELKPAALPIIPKAMWAEVQEWMDGWRYEKEVREAGLMAPGALLLHGPTGSGKTTMSQAILKYIGGRRGLVAEAHNLLTARFGESARAVATAFKVAELAGALLVIEEIEAMGKSRAENSGSCANEENKITVALMRCLESATVPVIATTNFREAIDPALLRRFEMQIEVPIVDEKGRALLLSKILGAPAPQELVNLPLVESIRIAHRLKRRAFLEGKGASNG